MCTPTHLESFQVFLLRDEAGCLVGRLLEDFSLLRVNQPHAVQHIAVVQLVDGVHQTVSDGDSCGVEMCL